VAQKGKLDVKLVTLALKQACSVLIVHRTFLA